MKEVIIGALVIICITLWTAFSLGACAFGIHYGWILAG